jgi:hypothetical protein
MASRLSDHIRSQTIESGFEPHPAQLQGNTAIVKFLLAGNAIFTLVNTKTGNRFTYRIRRPEEARGSVSHFVALLTGSDNESDYAYLGQIYSGSLANYAIPGAKSKIGRDAVSVRALDWLFSQLAHGRELPANVQVWHEAKCGRCARKLTVPSSIASGFGPECAGKIGG